ncbi:hypothetical protein [Fusobacterium mortiferum]|uniref:hypothetical protein n=1 Tax=Fusobacterium mortiferum TaxID=850 RepID=UPI00158C8E33|nr:hypothetical protein [Fusobacterium mortiferum]
MNAKIGRPTTNPRKIRLEIRLNEDENQMLKECVEKLNLTKTDVLIEGLKEVYKKIK